MAKPIGVYYRASVRIDGELRDALARFKAAHPGMNVTQAIRTALAVGLRSSDVSIETAFARQAFKEGVNRGVVAVKKAMQGMVAEALADLE
jgi:hypothetical protein